MGTNVECGGPGTPRSGMGARLRRDVANEADILHPCDFIDRRLSVTVT